MQVLGSLLVLIFAVYYINRFLHLFFGKQIKKHLVNNVIEDIKKTSNNFVEIAHTLNTLVYQNSCNFNHVKSQLPLNYPTEIQNYKILNSTQVDKNAYFFIVVVNYDSYNREEETPLYIKLVLNNNNETNFVVYSDLPENSIVKNMCNEFGMYLFIKLSA